MICGRTPEELLCEIKGFHGFVAPGILVGAFMVDLAYNHLGKNTQAHAIVETQHCLPDAVQIFTPCTVGNGWLSILGLDKYALTLYDRLTQSGIRVWMDLNKIKAFPHIHNWFMGHVSQKDQPEDLLINTIFRAGRDILSHASVSVTRITSPEKKGPMRICELCHEAYAASQGNHCLACQGHGYYEQAHA